MSEGKPNRYQISAQLIEAASFHLEAGKLETASVEAQIATSIALLYLLNGVDRLNELIEKQFNNQQGGEE